MLQNNIDTTCSNTIFIIVVQNKIDICKTHKKIKNIKTVQLSATEKTNILDFREALLNSAPEDFVNNPIILRDIVKPNELAVLVTPIDKEAPKGRLILPEAQTIRDLLDGNAYCIVTQQHQLKTALENSKLKPKIVVTDSQCFKEVAAITPKDIWLTSFSILFSRFKGDLISQSMATKTIDKLKANDRILIAEACSHHPIQDDIGRVKIPRWLQEYVGGELDFHVVQGLDFPEDLASYKLVIHCGACMFNRRIMLNRILQCKKADVPITNYGLVIAYSLGIFERALQPFPEIE